MYKSFFGLKENPFNVNPDPRYLFFTKQIEETLTGLMYGIQTRKGFITLTGEVGTGKTTLINRLLDWLRQRRARTAFLFNSRMNTNQLFDFILAEFEIACDSKSKSQQLMKLNHWLLERYRMGESGDAERQIASDRSFRTTRTRGKVEASRVAAIAAKNHAPMQDCATDKGRDSRLHKSTAKDSWGKC